MIGIKLLLFLLLQFSDNDKQPRERIDWRIEEVKEF